MRLYRKRKMQKEDIQKTLENKLAPVYKARVELVKQTDEGYFSSAAGEAELLNMALISQYVKKLNSDDELKKIHDNYFSTLFFHENQESLLAPLRQAGWNIDFNQQNFRRLIHHFAEDAGVDEFYNAMEEIPVQKAPINRHGDVKNWEEMKHSQVLTASIGSYYLNGEWQPVRKIEQNKINSYCNERLVQVVHKNLNIVFTQKRQYNY